MKRNAKTIIEYSIIILLSYGFIINTLHFITIRKTYTLNFETYFKPSDYKEKINDLEDRINAINSNDSKVQSIVKNIKSYIKVEKKSFMYKSNKKKSFNNIDKFQMFYQEHRISNLYICITTMSELDKNVNMAAETFRRNLMISAISTDGPFMTMLNNYNYQTYDFFSGNPIKEGENIDFQILRDQVYSYLSIAEYVVNWTGNYTGGTNE